MLLVNLFFAFLCASIPVVEEEKSKMAQITEAARTYVRKATDYCKETMNTLHLLYNRFSGELMSKFQSLRNRGDAKVEEHKQELNDFEELTEEKMKELLKQFYEKIGAGEQYESSEGEEAEEEEVKEGEMKEEVHEERAEV